MIKLVTIHKYYRLTNVQIDLHIDVWMDIGPKSNCIVIEKFMTIIFSTAISGFPA